MALKKHKHCRSIMLVSYRPAVIAHLCQLASSSAAAESWRRPQRKCSFYTRSW